MKYYQSHANSLIEENVFSIILGGQHHIGNENYKWYQRKLQISILFNMDTKVFRKITISKKGRYVKNQSLSQECKVWLIFGNFINTIDQKHNKWEKKSHVIERHLTKITICLWQSFWKLGTEDIPLIKLIYKNLQLPS